MLNTGGMTTLLLPFHQDERVSDQSIVLESATPVVPDLRGDNQWRRLQTLYDALGDEVATSLGDGDVTVVTGDCLALLGTLAGVQRSGLDPAIVWFDAHGDVHTIESSTSGYLGGMALRMALGGNADALAGPLGLRPVAASKAVLVDARDLDPAEVEYLADSPVGQFQVEAITAAELPPGPVILHVDLDVIDCSEVPGGFKGSLQQSSIEGGGVAWDVHGFREVSRTVSGRCGLGAWRQRMQLRLLACRRRRDGCGCVSVAG
mgnify:FL=1